MTLLARFAAHLERRHRYRDHQPRHRTGTVAPVPAGWNPLDDTTRAALRALTGEHQLVQPAPERAPV